MIKIHNIHKYFYKGEPREVHALRDISLEIKKGEFLALTGSSGCGKTTLLNAIGVLDSIDSGEIYLDGKEISKLSKDEKTDIRLNLNRHSNVLYGNRDDIASLQDKISNFNEIGAGLLADTNFVNQITSVIVPKIQLKLIASTGAEITSGLTYDTAKDSYVLDYDTSLLDGTNYTIEMKVV